MFAQFAVAFRVAALGMVLAVVGAVAPLPAAQASPTVHYSGASEQILQSLLTSTADDSSESEAARSDAARSDT
ncbi:hypothetical protein C6A85_50470, partial [Mycobacterium sp. ITM-2017-0098]